MKVVWLTLTVLVCLSATAMAQVHRPRMSYNAAHEITVSGTVVEVRDITPAGTPHGTYLFLKTPTDTLKVHLGPSWGVTKDRKALSPGDGVLVVGCFVNPGTSPILLAREVHKAGTVLTFRNAHGFPNFGPRRAP
jgi:hypothetical protein